ncbi:YicC family protein [Stieleria sp. TO1_6]|uniref:YicC/YloC family endoribonuclease n=1 Tax=Stieleria tagensis TaxID=2956795 RepID=UPI00209A9835|nr:YicC/YloC family endoribonuclease [Stieleria tagensis]MCO8123708.1 YicC family protein [Stieleria tagensis]
MTIATATNVRSMTGQGNAAGMTDLGNLTIELRTVNNRGFKSTIRVPEPLYGWESKIESVVREYLHRGSVNLSITIDQAPGQTPVQINEAILSAYARQCRDAIRQANLDGDPQVILNVAAMTSLPGVLSSAQNASADSNQVWPQVHEILVAAMRQLVAMREREGAHMAATLLEECSLIAAQVDAVQSLAPQAAENYRLRLDAKVKRVLQDYDVDVHAVDLLREVQVYADKADVSEEVTRLDSHLKLFQSVLNGDSQPRSGRDEPTGRKLDFVIQEMFRETNTIGSKSAHSDVAAVVVEIKCALERMRELIQNLE